MRIGLFGVLLLVLTNPADAQELPPAGSRVRVTSPVLKSGKESGAIVAIRGDTMLLARDFPLDTVPVAVAEIAQLEVSTGTYRPVLRHAGIGLAAGATAGLLLATGNSDSPEILSESQAAVLGIVLFGTTGAVLGGILGAMRVNDRWQVLPLGGVRGQARVLPTPTGVSISVSIAY